MMKKIYALLLLVLATASAGEHLVRIDLTEVRLAPLAQRGLRVLAELENCAIVLLDDAEFEKISSLDHQILASAPQEGDYYLARPMTGTADLTLFSNILTRDVEDYLIKVHQGMLEQVLNQKVMVKRLSFTPMVLSSAADLPVFPRVSYNETVAEILTLVDADSILAKVQRLQDFVTRLSIHDSCLAAAYHIHDRFTALGLDSVFFQYHTTGHAPNVIAIKRGTLYPDSIYAVICGHFDSYAFYSPNFAPGADDNASGTSAVLEAARVMRDYDFEYSIRYIAFSGEEYGMYGSGYYAQHARAQGDSILGVINGDMLAYVDIAPESLEVIAKPSNPPCEPFADFFIAAADTYTALLTHKQLSYTMVYSDHAPFWDQGYLALCNIEDWTNYGTNNPFIHSTGDSIGAGFNNLAFCTECTKAEIAALALLAVPVGTGIAEAPADRPGNVVICVRPSVSKGLFAISLASGSMDLVGLRIHDVTGRLVKNIALPSSETSRLLSVTWDGTDNAGQQLAAGIYFVAVDNGAATQTEKLVLIR
ncbi:M28 family peptidase [candidate division WOR-3 bacterium]|nr:M28 family peptidase [candidate division WOR-3 bacterium]